MTDRLLLAAAALALAGGAARAAPLSVDVGPTRIAGEVASFRELRDRGVVRQAHDYSCGAAAFATLLRYGLGEEAGEDEILARVFADASEAEQRIIENKGLSLLDMQRLARERGLRAQGARLAPDQLARIPRPVIVFIRPMGYAHFAVLKGIRGERAYLADPSQGNWTLPLPRFLDMWVDGESGRGVLLAVERPGGAWPAESPLYLDRGAGAAAAPGKEPVGEKPAAATAEQVTLRDQGVLLRRNQVTLELALAYGRAERDFGVTQLQQQVASAELAARWGLWNDLQLSARLPWTYRRSAAFNPDARAERQALGDAQVGFLAVVLREGVGRPNVILNLGGVVPSGPGDAGAGGGLAITKSYDPVILFASASYLRGLSVRPENPDRALARHNVGFNLGCAFAVNDAVALNGQLVGAVRSYPQAQATIRSREQYRLQLGLTMLVTRTLFLEPTVAVAVGAGSPDLTLGLNVPWSF